MATFSPVKSAAIAVMAVVVVALAAVPLALGGGSSGTRAKATAGRPHGGVPAAFAWLRPASAPEGWSHITTATSQAMLFYPPEWKQIPGDKGTVTTSLRDARGLYVGYLNATPRQATEQLHGWAAFRTAHNQDEGDRHVRQVAAAEDLRFRDARGSCVIDDYLSKVGGNPYREIACLVTGDRGTDVFIAAALKRDWPSLSGTLERAASGFLQG